MNGSPPPKNCSYYTRRRSENSTSLRSTIISSIRDNLNVPVEILILVLSFIVKWIQQRGREVTHR